MPRVVDLTHFFHDHSGGIKTYLQAKGQYLSEAGWQHAILVPGSRDRIGRWHRSILVSLWSPVVPRTHGYRLIVRTRRAVSLLLKLKPDVIELGSPYLLPTAAARAARRLGVPVVGFYHSHVPEAHLAPLMRALGLPVAGTFWGWAEARARAYLRRVLAPLDAVAAPSRAMADLLGEQGVVPAGACRVVALGADLRRFHPDRRSQAWRAQHLSHPSQTALLYAGRLSREKGVSRLLEAFRLLACRFPGRFAFWVAGDGPMRPAVQRSRIPGLAVLGYLTEEALATAYASADAFVTASQCETFGLACAEAQASGLPVVAPRCGALPEVVDPRSGVLVEPDSPETLAAGVLQVTDEPERRRALAREFACSRFDWGRTFASLLELYQELRERKMAGARAVPHPSLLARRP